MNSQIADGKQAFERELGALAKQFRSKAGISKAEAARQLKVNRGTIQQAEEYPDLSLTRLRIRMIEVFSQFNVEGPVFILKRKALRKLSS